MNLIRKYGVSKDLLALRILTWVRRHPWLRAMLRFLPARLRADVHRSLVVSSGASTSFPRTTAWGRPAPRAREIAVANGADRAAGVNLYAYFRGQFGLAECARQYAKALLDLGYPVTLQDIDLEIPHGFDDRTFDLAQPQSAQHDIHLLFVNPDYLDEAMDKVGRTRFDGGYIIACWFWELERIPESWLAALAQVDEIMVASGFIEEAFRRVTDKPIYRLPIPVGETQDSGLGRADFGLREGVFVFLSTFDFNSSIARKNPFAVVDAFKQAFPPGRDDVQLLIKSSNGYRYPEQLLSLLEAAAADSRILVRDEIIDAWHLQALHRCIDAYVSLHRAEGFGLGLAECMRLGKPVVATAWSGNMEFMVADDSCLVGYELVPVAEHQYPFWQGQRWAEPDASQAAGCMRRLADDPAFAARIGARASVRIRHTLSPSSLADRLAEHLDAIRLAHDRA